ncbi:MAG: hypothetical protein WB791_07705 [Waddliaceae bacterium]
MNVSLSLSTREIEQRAQQLLLNPSKKHPDQRCYQIFINALQEERNLVAAHQSGGGAKPKCTMNHDISCILSLIDSDVDPDVDDNRSIQKSHLLYRISYLINLHITPSCEDASADEREKFAIVNAFLCSQLQLPETDRVSLLEGRPPSISYTELGDQDVDSEIQSVIHSLETIKKLDSDPHAEPLPPPIDSLIEDDSDVDDSDPESLAPKVHTAYYQKPASSTWSVAGVCREIFDHFASLGQWIAGSLRSIWTWMRGS